MESKIEILKIEKFKYALINDNEIVVSDEEIEGNIFGSDWLENVELIFTDNYLEIFGDKVTHVFGYDRFKYKIEELDIEESFYKKNTWFGLGEEKLRRKDFVVLKNRKKYHIKINNFKIFYLGDEQNGRT